MSVVKGLKNLFVGGEDEEYYDDEPVVEEQITSEISDREAITARIKNIQSNSSVQIVLARPSDFGEVKAIGDDLNAGKTVLLNLETVNANEAQRILDFLSGVAHANEAEMKIMAQKTYAFMPKNVGFSGVDLSDEVESESYSFNDF